MREPTLAARTLPIGDGYRVKRTFRVIGGLRFIRSNNKPYFSITVECHRLGFPNQCWSGGCAHDEIERYYPGRFTDLIALHLSNIDGAPSHAEANGWYNLAAALGGAGERFHAGNSNRHFPSVAPVDKFWRTTEYREPNQGECVQLFADHCRIPLAEAQAFIAEIQTIPVEDGLGAIVTGNVKAMRDAWRAKCESLRPMWKAQAEACIARHNLVVFGDAYAVEAA